MPINDFDRGLIEKFEAHDYEYNPAQWERLSQQLPVRQNSMVKRYIWLPLSGVAAAIALLIGVPMMMKKGNESNSIVSATRTITPVTHNTAAQQMPPVTAGADITEARPIEEPITVSPVPKTSRNNGNTTSGLSLVARSTANDDSVPSGSSTQIIPLTTNIQVLKPHNSIVTGKTAYNTPGIVNRTPRHFTPQSISKEPIAADVIIPHAELPVHKTEQQPVTVNLQLPVERLNANEPEKQQVVNPRFDATIDPDDIGFNHPSKKTSLSIAGGYNQGSTNVGYMVGVNTRKHLGSKLYVEGDLAFAANRNNDQTLSMQTTTYESYARNGGGGFANNLKSSPATSTVNNMYYLQVTPTVGYQLMSKLAIGAGADVQRLFQPGDKTAFIAESGTMMPVPTMDYGLVGKTEYSLLRNLKAGVQYRYGMNNVLSPDKNYVNRSYLQVQLKLGILGNK